MNPANAVKILNRRDTEAQSRRRGFTKVGSRKVRKGGAKSAKVNEALRPLRLSFAAFA
jgi:hypothetical protein